MPVKVGSIVIHCREFDRMVAFWQHALNYADMRAAAAARRWLREHVDHRATVTTV